MGFQQKGIIVIRVARSDGGRWHVLESDFDDPVAAFDDRQSACDYATRLSASRDEATVVLLDDSMHAYHGGADAAAMRQGSGNARQERSGDQRR